MPLANTAAHHSAPAERRQPAGRQAWWERPAIIAASVSLFVHLALAAILALIFLRMPARLGEGDGEFSLALLNEQDLSDLSARPLGAEDPFAERLTSEEALFDTLDPEAPFANLSTLRSEADRSATLTGAGEADATLSASGGGASFFGVAARGSRFAYVLDVSGSMTQGTRLSDLRRAIVSSIENLAIDTHFAVFLYSQNAIALSESGWVRAGDHQKAFIERRIDSIEASGATNPVPAFQLAFSLKPLPDAVYFMTDGLIPEDQQAGLMGLLVRTFRDGERRVPIHCIAFDSDESEPFMRRLAQSTGGSFTHVKSGRRP